MSLKIYYLDDEPDLLELFVDTFSDSDVIIETFSDAEKAISAAKKSPPGLFIIDFRLPGITGDVVATKVDKEIPKVLITGDLNVKTSVKFDAILSKPFRTEDVIAIIEKYKVRKR